MLIETFLSCLSSKNSCSPILQLHRSMVVFCCHLVLDNFVFFFRLPVCLLLLFFFHTLLVCNFLLIYLFLDGLSHEKQLINAYAESKSHSSYFLRQDCRYIVCVHVHAMFTHIYWTVFHNVVIMLIWKKTAHRINLQICTHFKTEKSQMNFSCIWIILLAHCK